MDARRRGARAEGHVGHVFISYSRSDRAYVEKLAAHLEATGLDVWFDYDIPTGDRWSSIIKRKIETCDMMIVVMSRAAEESAMVENEIDLARARAKALVPLLLDGEPFFGLRHIQYTDVRGGTLPGRAFIDVVLGRFSPTMQARPSMSEPTAPPQGQPQKPALRPAQTGAAPPPDHPPLVPGETFATLHTSFGLIRIKLMPNDAPKTVANFVGLAQGTMPYTDPRTGGGGAGPYYDGVIFHRVIPNFMIQGGDPTGTGRGGPGYSFNDEFQPNLAFDRPYLLAMANAGKRPDGSGTNGSQFFITVAPTPHLNRKHTIFGEVADQASRRVVDRIATTRTGGNDRPLQDIIIERVDIEAG
jgi:peptidyl-prolyl cis-trans isomerase A (cyclophilin A)